MAICVSRSTVQLRNAGHRALTCSRHDHALAAGHEQAYHRRGHALPLADAGEEWAMQIVVVGAGPTELFLGMTLARRGHGVTVVDRDPGPRPDGSWPPRGVMQFHHPHAFRAQVAETLQEELPDTWDDLLVAGAEPMMA